MGTGRGFARITLFMMLLLCVCFTAACASPEAARARGEGPGADVGNRPASVVMHAGSDPFWKTPNRISVEHVPLEPGRQAKERSTGNRQ